MKKMSIYLFVILGPFLIMVGVNEYMRPRLKDTQHYSYAGLTAMNSGAYSPDRCSWSCYNNTTKCKRHHTTLLAPYMDIIDPLYFGLINLLQKVPGGYGFANILFLVIGWPGLMMFLLLKSIGYEEKIREMKEDCNVHS